MADPTVSPWTGWVDWAIKGLLTVLFTIVAWLYRTTHKRIDAIGIASEANEKRIIALEAQQQNNSEAWRSIHEDILRIERKMEERFSAFESINQKFWEQLIDLNKERSHHDSR